MKIILIADRAGDIRNYADSTLQRNGQAWFVPEIGSDWTAIVCPAVKITRLGMHISEKFASRYYDNICAVAMFFPGGGVIAPEYAAEEFFVSDSALCVGNGVSIGDAGDRHIIKVGDMSMEFDASTLEIDKMLSKISGYATLKMGDILIFGYENIKVAITEGSHLTATIDSADSINLKIK